MVIDKHAIKDFFIKENNQTLTSHAVGLALQSLSLTQDEANKVISTINEVYPLGVEIAIETFSSIEKFKKDVANFTIASENMLNLTVTPLKEVYNICSGLDNDEVKRAYQIANSLMPLFK